jgi:hypothetical protein
MSEYDGALRVASTEQPQWFPDGSVQGQSESFVTVLAEHGNVLAPIGRVGGLGKGERIYAVRFAGDKGFVVTFHQTDPLYTLDLSDKTDPKVAGELDLLGYSAYLHPISDSLVLGVGQDADLNGRQLGTQVSLFDVSDLHHPLRRAKASLGGSSTAEFDPHAFLYWGPTRLAVIPLQTYGGAGAEFNGAVGFRIGAASIDEVGRIVHPGGATYGDTTYAPPIGRSLVIGDKLFTLSYAGLAMSRLDTLSPLTFTAFPAPDPAPSPGPVPLPAAPVPAPAGVGPSPK